jgi:protein SCO1/2
MGGGLCLGRAALHPAAAQPAVLDGIRGVDQQGRPLEARRLAGHPVLLHFVFAGCTSSCPTQLLELAELHRGLPEAARRRIRFVSVTVDPLSDTPQALAALARRMGADREGWTFLSGRP